MHCALKEQLAYVHQRIDARAKEGSARAEIDGLQQQIDDAGVTNNKLSDAQLVVTSLCECMSLPGIRL